MDRTNHYEVAFESYLQERRVCYVAVDETRRALIDDASVKSLDFMVFGRDGARLVVDIKGRRFPGGPAKKPRKVWESWSFRDDIDGLQRWADLAGPGFRPLLVFAYLLSPRIELADNTPDLQHHRGRRYLYRAVEASEYRRHMRTRSPSWGTVCLPLTAFRSLVRPLSDYLQTAPEPDAVPF